MVIITKKSIIKVTVDKEKIKKRKIKQ